MWSPILNPFGRKCFNKTCPYCYTYLKYCVVFSDVHIPGRAGKFRNGHQVELRVQRHARWPVQGGTHRRGMWSPILNPFGRKCFNKTCPYCYTYLKYCVVFSDVHIPGTVNKNTSSWDVSVSILGAGGREAESYRRHALAHIYIHTYTHTYMHTYTYTYIQTYVRRYICTCIHTYIYIIAMRDLILSLH